MLTPTPNSVPDADTQRALLVLLARQRHSWEQGVLAAALEELGHHDLLQVALDDAVARQLPDGRLAELDRSALVNSGSVGHVLLAWSGDAARREAVERQRRWLVVDAPRAEDGTLFHLVGADEVWADSVFMVVPFLLAVGEVDIAVAQLDGHRCRLRDSSTGLWAARWDERTGQHADPRHWGTANGWVAAAAARALRRSDLPAAVRDRLAAEAHQVIDACLGWRRESGLFGDVVDDPASFTEANLAQMLAYAAMSGAADGWLPAGYGDLGRSLLRSARSRLDALGQVTAVAAAPSFQRPGTSPEAQGFFVLATAAEHRLPG
jgi:unsaturated rhamnogalacturonyl hydrolase